MSRGGIYQLKLGEVKYIGQTNNFERRKQQHFNEIEKWQIYKWNIVRQLKEGGSLSLSFKKFVYMLYKLNLEPKDIIFEEVEIIEPDINKLVIQFPEITEHFKFKYKNLKKIEDNLKKVEREKREQHHIIKNKSFILGLNGINSYVFEIYSCIEYTYWKLEHKPTQLIIETILKDPYLDFQFNLWKNQNKAFVESLKEIDSGELSWDKIIPHSFMPLKHIYGIDVKDFRFLEEFIKDKEMEYINYFEVNIAKAKSHRKKGVRSLLPKIKLYENKEEFIKVILKDFIN